MEEPLQLGEVLKRSREWLSGRGVDNAAREVDELACRALSCRRIDLYLLHDRQPSPAELEELRRLLRRRAQGEPLQYLLGSQPFRQAEIRVDSRVLIPRPETEELVDLVLAREGRHSALTVLDAGTGSGCIAISLAQELPSCQVLAVDSSRAALDLARENAVQNGVAERIQFRQLNLLQAWPQEQVDVVVSNPPYVAEFERALLAPELSHEPQDALFGGEDGLLFYRRFAQGLDHLLKPRGRFYFEIGAGQGEALLAVFVGRCRHLELGRDLSGRPRFLSGQFLDPPPTPGEDHEHTTSTAPGLHPAS